MEDGSVVQENGIRDGRVDRAAGAGRSEPREGTTIMPAAVARGCATWLHEVRIRDGRVDRAAGAGRSEPREGTTIMPAAVRRPRAATETAV